MTRALLLVALLVLAAGCEADTNIDTCPQLAPEVRANVESWSSDVVACRDVDVDGCAHCELDTPYWDGQVLVWTVPGGCDAFEVCAELGGAM